MNYPPSFPVNLSIIGFQELKQTEKEYFSAEEEIPLLSESDRLIFLSHFQAIGKMWEYLEELSKIREERFKEKWDIKSIKYECDGPCILMLTNGQFIETDSSGEIYETDIPSDTDCFPQIAVDISLDYSRIWDSIEERIESFCNVLGYNFEWDEYSIRLSGHGIKTEGSCWSSDWDDYFVNMEMDP